MPVALKRYTGASWNVLELLPSGSDEMHSSERCTNPIENLIFSRVYETLHTRTVSNNSVCVPKSPSETSFCSSGFN